MIALLGLQLGGILSSMKACKEGFPLDLTSVSLVKVQKKKKKHRDDISEEKITINLYFWGEDEEGALSQKMKSMDTHMTPKSQVWNTKENLTRNFGPTGSSHPLLSQTTYFHPN